MIYFVTGGARSGKSNYAQQLALSLSDSPVYVATAKRWDEDFEQRVKLHQQQRDERWTTIEELKHLAMHPIDNRVCVIDCATLWLTNFFVDCKYDPAYALVQFKEEMDALQQRPGTFIIISNEIGMGVHAENEAARKFTDLQGWANQCIAAMANTVILMVSGIPVTIKQPVEA
jgi:adenosylcobinamide kinase / adenosylcobinamide-phosphate guanylyltransferase